MFAFETRRIVSRSKIDNVVDDIVKLLEYAKGCPRVIWFYKLQDRGDCQNARKSCKTSQSASWVVGWEQNFCPDLPPAGFSAMRKLTPELTNAACIKWELYT